MEQLVIEKAVDCTRCGLCKTRNQVVFAHGTRRRGIMLIGEGPGGEEDEEGKPFVGMAGKLVKKWMAYVGLSRKKDFIVTNVVKCRPPGNRIPHPEEIEACRRWLTYELKQVRPWLIITLGKTAAQEVLGRDNFFITRDGGCAYPWLLGHLGYFTTTQVIVFPLLHPAFVLRNPDGSEMAYEQLDRLKKVLRRAPDA